jgi:hypothetical protein
MGLDDLIRHAFEYTLVTNSDSFTRHPFYRTIAALTLDRP